MGARVQDSSKLLGMDLAPGAFVLEFARPILPRSLRLSALLVHELGTRGPPDIETEDTADMDDNPEFYTPAAAADRPSLPTVQEDLDWTPEVTNIVEQPKSSEPNLLQVNLQKERRQETEAHQGHKLKELQEEKEAPLEPKALLQEPKAMLQEPTEMREPMDSGDRYSSHSASAKAFLDRIIRGHHVDGEAGLCSCNRAFVLGSPANRKDGSAAFLSTGAGSSADRITNSSSIVGSSKTVEVVITEDLLPVSKQPGPINPIFSASFAEGKAASSQSVQSTPILSPPKFSGLRPFELSVPSPKSTTVLTTSFDFCAAVPKAKSLGPGASEIVTEIPKAEGLAVPLSSKASSPPVVPVVQPKTLPKAPPKQSLSSPLVNLGKADGGPVIVTSKPPPPLEAQQLVTEAQTKAAVEVAQVQSQAASFAAHTASEAAHSVAQTQANAAQAIMNHERTLMSQFAEREKDLVAQILELQQELVSARATSPPSLRHNDAELMVRIDQLVERMGTFEFDLVNMNQRLVALEHWGFDDTNAVGDPEEELIPDTGIPPPPVPPISPARSARHVPRSNQQSEDDDDDPLSMEDQCLRWKDVSSVKIPPLPDSAGALRSWKNAVLPMLIALDKSDQNFLYTWLMEAFHAKLPHEVEGLRFDSGGFPRFDRVLCSWLTRDSCLRGYFGPRIQSYLEESMTRGLQLRGRVLLNMIIREFDLDGALGGVVSSVELFQIPSPEGDQASLISFRDRVQFILGQLPITDRPPDAMLSKWLFERLKRIRSMHIVLDRIRESGSNAVERSFEYLWGRLQRQIAEQQHEKNLSSIQEGLRKGPKKLGTPAAPSKGSPDPKAALATTQGGEGKGKGKPKGKGGLGKGAQPKAKAVPAAPKSKPGLVAMLVMGTAANVATSASVASSSFDIEFALDSGAGEDLGSIPAFMRQGVCCDTSRCVTATRVEHCVPIFTESVSFVSGMPATVASGMPAFDADVPAGSLDVPLSETVVPEAVSSDPPHELSDLEGIEAIIRGSGSPVGPISGDLDQAEGNEPKGSPPSAFEEGDSKIPPRIPIDHLLTHQPAHPSCDVCRQAKLRSHAHKRFKNQSEEKQFAQIIEAPRSFLQKIACDHLESSNAGFRGEQYALICVDAYSGVVHAYPAQDKTQVSVEAALRHFCRETRSIVASDRYPSILAAVRDLGLYPDPSVPNDPLHNALAESAIRNVRQGTRSLLLQSGLGVEFWPRAMTCFTYQHDFTTALSHDPDGLRHLVRQQDDSLPDGVEGPVPPPVEYDSKIHMALQYQPDTRMIPFGALVWYLSRVKDFAPSGIPAIYVGPEVLPAMRCKDVHILFDLPSLTQSDRVREIVTKDFVTPSGRWIFPFTHVPMLKSLLPEIPPSRALADDEGVEDFRHRSITKRRVLQYGPSPECDGCLRGTYSHTAACRARFNALLNAAEPLASDPGGGMLAEMVMVM
eukprot:s240_g13.t1